MEDAMTETKTTAGLYIAILDKLSSAFETSHLITTYGSGDNARVHVLLNRGAEVTYNDALRLAQVAR